MYHEHCMSKFQTRLKDGGDNTDVLCSRSWQVTQVY